VVVTPALTTSNGKPKRLQLKYKSKIIILRSGSVLQGGLFLQNSGRVSDNKRITKD